MAAFFVCCGAYFSRTFFTTSWAAPMTIDSMSSASGAGRVLP
jgi:hypothetical protein